MSSNRSSVELKQNEIIQALLKDKIENVASSSSSSRQNQLFRFFYFPDHPFILAWVIQKDNSNQILGTNIKLYKLDGGKINDIDEIIYDKKCHVHSVDFRNWRVAVTFSSDDLSNSLEIWEIHKNVIKLAANFSDDALDGEEYSTVLLAPDSHYLYYFTKGIVKLGTLLENRIFFTSIGYYINYSNQNLEYNIPEDHYPALSPSGCLVYVNTQGQPCVFDLYGDNSYPNVSPVCLLEQGLHRPLEVSAYVPESKSYPQIKAEIFIEFFIRNRIYADYPIVLLNIIAEYISFFPTRRAFGLTMIDNISALNDKKPNLKKILHDLHHQLQEAINQNQTSYLPCIQKIAEEAMKQGLIKMQKRVDFPGLLFSWFRLFKCHYMPEPTIDGSIELCKLLNRMLQSEMNLGYPQRPAIEFDCQNKSIRSRN